MKLFFRITTYGFSGYILAKSGINLLMWEWWLIMGFILLVDLSMIKFFHFDFTSIVDL
jgi:hypothetical protein